MRWDLAYKCLIWGRQNMEWAWPTAFSGTTIGGNDDTTSAAVRGSFGGVHQGSPTQSLLAMEMGFYRKGIQAPGVDRKL